MKRNALALMSLAALCFASLCFTDRAEAQQASTKELSKQEITQLVPTNYFFAGQTATTQVRNAGGVRFSDGKFLLIALVDNSGYSTGIAQKYQGLLITQVALDLEGKPIEPGSYGFGLPSADHVGILDINANEIAGGATTAAADAQRPVPLRLTVGEGGIVVNMGKRSFTLKPKS